MPKIGAISNQQTMLWMKRRALDRNQPLKQLDPDFLAQMREIFQLMDMINMNTSRKSAEKLFKAVRHSSGRFAMLD